MLTARQHELLTFICDYIAEKGIPPTFDEMGARIQVSKGNISRLLKCLYDRGFIKYLPHRARSLEVLRYPNGCEPPNSISFTVPEQKMIKYLRAHPDAYRRVMRHVGIWN